MMLKAKLKFFKVDRFTWGAPKPAKHLGETSGEILGEMTGEKDQ